MVKKAYCPKRGDFIWLDFTPQVGHEQAGRRPALVLSHDEYNRKAGLVLVCPATSHVKGYPFEVLLPAGWAISGVVLSDQIRSVDWRGRHATFLGRASESLLEEALAKLFTLLGDDQA